MRILRVLSTLDQFWRSLLFTLITAVFTVFYSALCLIAWAILPVNGRYRIIQFWTLTEIWLLRVLCGIHYHVEGVGNIPKDRAGVVLCKHQSTWETFFLPQFFFPATVILKRELFWVPFFGWGMATIAPIAIDRNNQKSAMQQIIEQGKRHLQQGRWIIVYPEGTRTLPGHVGKYRSGGARLAVEAGSPVLPVAHNAGYFWPKQGFLKRPGTVQVAFGPLIETTGKTAEEVLAEAKNWIETRIQQFASHPLS